MKKSLIYIVKISNIRNYYSEVVLSKEKKKGTPNTLWGCCTKGFIFLAHSTYKEGDVVLVMPDLFHSPAPERAIYPFKQLGDCCTFCVKMRYCTLLSLLWHVIKERLWLVFFVFFFRGAVGVEGQGVLR